MSTAGLLGRMSGASQPGHVLAEGTAVLPV